jgi:hypothetical protein
LKLSSSRRSDAVVVATLHERLATDRSRRNVARKIDGQSMLEIKSFSPSPEILHIRFIYVAFVERTDRVASSGRATVNHRGARSKDR